MICEFERKAWLIGGMSDDHAWDEVGDAIRRMTEDGWQPDMHAADVQELIDRERRSGDGYAELGRKIAEQWLKYRNGRMRGLLEIHSWMIGD